jgi:hypothetical protein
MGMHRLRSFSEWGNLEDYTKPARSGLVDLTEGCVHC